MPNILRLNCKTFPMLPVERRILEAAGTLIEVEDFEECAHPEEIDAVQIVAAYLRRPAVEKLTRCKIVSRMGNGCDKIDLDACSERGIIVANVPDSFTAEVADHTMALMLAGLRKLHEMESMARRGTRPADAGGIRRIATLTLGLVGFGKIGRMVAKRARAFDMRVIVSDPALSDADAQAHGVPNMPLSELLAQADVVSLLCPLLPSTRKMINRETIALMKQGVIFVNTARGELVDAAALIEALETGKIAFAGIDVFGETNVFQNGGFPTSHPIFHAPNTLLTPHVSANSIEAREETSRRSAEAIVNMLNGILPVNIVNRRELEVHHHPTPTSH